MSVGGSQVKCPFCYQISATSQKVRAGFQATCPSCGKAFILTNELISLVSTSLTPVHVGVSSAASSKKEPDLGLATVMGFFVPGLGQMYRGKVGEGFLWFLASIIGYIVFIVPGIIIHVLSVYKAAQPDES